jgi:urease accessory protein
MRTEERATSTQTFTRLSEEQQQPIQFVHQPHLASPLPRVQGRLRLCFQYDQTLQQTVLQTCEQQSPLKVIRAFPLADGAALVHLHNVSGGVLGGDQLAMLVEVGPGASAQLTTTSATRLYRPQASMPEAVQTNEIIVRENALLEYLPDALIPFAGVRYRQETTINLAQGAGLFWWEIVAPGRAARGEQFAYERLQLNLAIKANGRMVAVERSRLVPQQYALRSIARLGAYSYFASFYILRVGLDAAQWLALETELNETAMQLSVPNEILWGASTLSAHGLVVRVLSVNGRRILPGWIEFWRLAKQKLYGRAAVLPRKIW